MKNIRNKFNHIFIILLYSSVLFSANIHAEYSAYYHHLRLVPELHGQGSTAPQACQDLIKNENAFYGYNNSFDRIIYSVAEVLNPCGGQLPLSILYPQCVNLQGSCEYFAVVSKSFNPEKKYTIKLSQVMAKPSIHGNYITDIYPAKNFINNSEPNVNPIITSDEIVATVYDENGQKINNVNIHVEIEPIESTAGHFNHGVRPKKVSTYGQLVTTTTRDLQLDGNTGTEGFKFRYLASELSGDYNMKVTCKDKVCNLIQPSKIWVGVENLISLEKIASLYEFVGDKPTHPDNHYVTEKTRVKMITLAAKYKTKFPNNAVLHYNDSSLERGGLFDVGKTKWKPPHKRHRVGTDVDVRANEASGNIPSKDDVEFSRLAKKSGCFARIEYVGTTNEHFHLYCERKYDK